MRNLTKALLVRLLKFTDSALREAISVAPETTARPEQGVEHQPGILIWYNDELLGLGKGLQNMGAELSRIGWSNNHQKDRNCIKVPVGTEKGLVVGVIYSLKTTNPVELCQAVAAAIALELIFSRRQNTQSHFGAFLAECGINISAEEKEIIVRVFWGK